MPFTVYLVRTFSGSSLRLNKSALFIQFILSPRHPYDTRFLYMKKRFSIFFRISIHLQTTKSDTYLNKKIHLKKHIDRWVLQFSLCTAKITQIRLKEQKQHFFIAFRNASLSIFFLLICFVHYVKHSATVAVAFD